MKKQNIALIDIGSNSIRLVIFRLDDRGFYKEIQNLKVVARLSSHFDKKGNITEKGTSILIHSLLQFKDVIHTYNVTKIKCVGTAALRQAQNQSEIIEKVLGITNFAIRILSEYEEAYFGFLAVTNSTEIIRGYTIDIGGGSTEVTLFENKKMIHYHSFPFGAITLHDTFIKSDNPTKGELAQLKTFLLRQFQSIPWIKPKQYPLIGIGGSARNLSLIHQRKIDYPLSGLHQYEINFEEFYEVVKSIESLPLKQRQAIDGLSKDRADIIVPASEAILTLMEVICAKSFIMSNKGLRDGLFYEEIFLQLNIDGFPNIAEESFYQLSQDFEIQTDEVKYISKIVTMLYRILIPTNQHNEDDLRLLHLACRVLYLGDFISHESSSKHTFYLLTNLSIDGLTHRERVIISLIASFKSRNQLNLYLARFKDWFSKEEIEKIELLGAMLKFSFSLNRTKQQLITDVTVGQKGISSIEIELKYSAVPYFEITQSQKYKKHLEKSLKKQLILLFSEKS